MKKLTTKVAIGALVAAAAFAGAVAFGSSAASAAPAFQLPFPCGQVWDGSTRTSHSPARAVDFNRTDDYGDPVVASAAGTVSRVGNEGSVSYGRWVEVNHGSGYTTRYAHLSSQSVYVGQRVAAGQRLGALGSTGNSTGPHLHYEQRYNGTAIPAYFNGVRAYYWGHQMYTSRNCGGTTTSPYSITALCGTGATVIDSQAITGATIYLTYNRSTGKNCVATLKTSSIGTKTLTSAFIEVQGGTRQTDSGYFQNYAGPVSVYAPDKCVRWGGSTSAGSYTSPFEHC